MNITKQKEILEPYIIEQLEKEKQEENLERDLERVGIPLYDDYLDITEEPKKEQKKSRVIIIDL